MERAKSVREQKKEVVEEIIQREQHYLVFSEHDHETEEDRDQEDFERSKEEAVSAIFQLQSTINNLQIELEGKKDYLRFIHIYRKFRNPDVPDSKL